MIIDNVLIRNIAILAMVVRVFLQYYIEHVLSTEIHLFLFSIKIYLIKNLSFDVLKSGTLKIVFVLYLIMLR